LGKLDRISIVKEVNETVEELDGKVLLQGEG